MIRTMILPASLLPFQNLSFGLGLGFIIAMKEKGRSGQGEA
jgi:hypothetical protein